MVRTLSSYILTSTADVPLIGDTQTVGTRTAAIAAGSTGCQQPSHACQRESGVDGEVACADAPGAVASIAAVASANNARIEESRFVMIRVL